LKSKRRVGSNVLIHVGLAGLSTSEEKEAREIF